MQVTLPLDQLTVQEKLALMEQLWEDLARTPEAIESPAWHKDVLDERGTGENRYSDWEDVKNRIRQKRQ